MRDSQQQYIRENIQYFHSRPLSLSVIPQCKALRKRNKGNHQFSCIENLFSFERGMRVEAETFHANLCHHANLVCQLSPTLILVRHVRAHKLEKIRYSSRPVHLIPHMDKNVYLKQGTGPYRETDPPPPPRERFLCFYKLFFGEFVCIL